MTAHLALVAEGAGVIAPRSQMGFSLGWHIILACLGVGLPGLTLFLEWQGYRTQDPAYRLLARRWARAMGVLFAVGAVSGTILSFEMGLLWSGLMQHYGSVIGLPFAIEGFAFFIEAIFLGIYLYGWDRLSPRAHLLMGVPDLRRRRLVGVLRGVRERLDEQPAGFQRTQREAGQRSPRGRPCSTPPPGRRPSI